MSGAPFAGDDAPASSSRATNPGAGNASAPAALPGLPLRFSDPLRVLLCWAALLYREGCLDARLLSRAGISAADLSAFADESAEALCELRRLRLAGALFGRAELGALWRARLAEGLMGATRMGEVLALTRALACAPDWAWEEEFDKATTRGGRSGRGAEGAEAAAEAAATGKHWEALAGKARAELARRAGEMAQRGAATADGVLPPQSLGAAEEAGEWAQLERLGALLERCEAAELTGQAPRRVRNASYACGPGRQPSPTKAKRKPRR